MNREAAQSGLPHFPPHSALPPDSEANHVVLAFALRVAETWEVVHRNSSSCGFGGSRGGVPLLVAVTVKLRLPPRQSRGVSYRTLGSSPRRRTNLALDARSTFPAPFFALRLCAALHEAQGFAFGGVIADRSVALGHCDGAVALVFVDTASDLGFLTTNTLLAADRVQAPPTPSTWSCAPPATGPGYPLWPGDGW